MRRRGSERLLGGATRLSLPAGIPLAEAARVPLPLWTAPLREGRAPARPQRARRPLSQGSFSNGQDARCPSGRSQQVATAAWGAAILAAKAARGAPVRLWYGTGELSTGGPRSCAAVRREVRRCDYGAERVISRHRSFRRIGPRARIMVYFPQRKGRMHDYRQSIRHPDAR